MRKVLKQVQISLLFFSLAFAFGCSDDAKIPTENLERLSLVGRLERGSTVRVSIWNGSDSIPIDGLPISITPQEAARKENDGSLSLLATGLITLRAELSNGRLISQNFQVARPPSIVYDLDVDGKRAVYHSSLDGGDFRIISSTTGTNLDPTAAGDVVVYTSFRSGKAYLYATSLAEVFASSPDAVISERRITTYTSANETQPAISPDGLLLAFVRDSGGVGRIWVVTIYGTQLTRITNTNTPSPESSPAWHKNKQILFTSTESGNADFSVASATMPRFITPLTTANTKNAEVEGSWNAEGTKVAFISTRSGKPQLYVLNTETEQVALIALAGNNVAQPAWLPDGRIVFATYDSGEWKLAWIDPDTSDGPKQIPIKGKNPQNPAAVQ